MTTRSTTTVVEVRYVLLTGLKLQPISETNKLPTACNEKEVLQKKAVKEVAVQHHRVEE